MPYHYNPQSKRTEWQRYWEGTDYGPEPGKDDPRLTTPTPPAGQPTWGTPEFNAAVPYPEGATVDYNQPQQPTQPTAPTTPTYSPTDWGNKDPNFIRAQVDRLWAKYGRTPTEADYQNWIRYVQTPNVNGAGQQLNGWDPYWAYRMDRGAQGEEWGHPIPGYDYGNDPNYNAEWETRGAGNVDLSSSVDRTIQTPTTVGANAPMPTPYQPTGADSQIQAEARQRILDLLRTPQTVDPQSLRDSPEMQAVYLTAQRAQERERAALAERAAAGGWSGSGGFEGQLTGLREKQGETEMTFMSQLATDYMERNRDNLLKGIEFALNQGQFDQAEALKRELGYLDAAIEREKIGAELSMNADDVQLRKLLGLGDLDLRRYLGQLGSQYNYDDLDFQKNKWLMEHGDVPNTGF